VIYRHGLRAALVPIVTQFGIDVATLLGGAKDEPVIIAVVLLAVVFVVVANIVVELLYAVLDPRVRLT